MPKLSRFFGIEIEIRSRETNHRLPHFHATYGDDEISIAIQTLEVLAGKFNQRALALVIEWTILHRAELQLAWDEIRAGRKPQQIEGLK
ncbi:MAG: DUF4160 domain-containing protein [Chthoniobacteraceae bacterium]